MSALWCLHCGVCTVVSALWCLFLLLNSHILWCPLPYSELEFQNAFEEKWWLYSQLFGRWGAQGVVEVVEREKMNQQST